VSEVRNRSQEKGVPYELLQGVSTLKDKMKHKIKHKMFIVIGLSSMLISPLAMAAIQAGVQAGQTTKQATGPAPSPVSGKAMFDLYCVPCHGKEGKGDGPAAAALKQPPADLTRISARNKGTFPVDTIRAFIDGRQTVSSHGSREMPVWGGLFVDVDRDSDMGKIRIANLTDYLRSIQK
jgi:mono/diheme cytochrome c family protein